VNITLKTGCIINWMVPVIYHYLLCSFFFFSLHLSLFPHTFSVSIMDVECIREGCQSETLRQLVGSVPEGQCLTVVFKGPRKSLDLLCQSQEEAQHWARGIQTLQERVENMTQKEKLDQYPNCCLILLLFKISVIIVAKMKSYNTGVWQCCYLEELKNNKLLFVIYANRVTSENICWYFCHSPLFLIEEDVSKIIESTSIGYFLILILPFNTPFWSDYNTVYFFILLSPWLLCLCVTWIHAYLSRADQNNDDKMSYEEVQTLLQMINIDLSDQYARSLFQVVGCTQTYKNLILSFMVSIFRPVLLLSICFIWSMTDHH